LGRTGHSDRLMQTTAHTKEYLASTVYTIKYMIGEDDTVRQFDQRALKPEFVVAFLKARNSLVRVISCTPKMRA